MIFILSVSYSGRLKISDYFMSETNEHQFIEITVASCYIAPLDISLYFRTLPQKKITLTFFFKNKFICV